MALDILKSSTFSKGVSLGGLTPRLMLHDICDPILEVAFPQDDF